MEKKNIYQKPEVECLGTHTALMQSSGDGSMAVGDAVVDGGTARGKDYYYDDDESGSAWDD